MTGLELGRGAGRPGGKRENFFFALGFGLTFSDKHYNLSE